MDPSGTFAVPPGTLYRATITAAAAGAVAGETILVQGMVDAAGNPLGLSEEAFYGFGTGESFPIGLRAGVTLKPANSYPVRIWSTGQASALISVISGSAMLTTIEDLTLVGGLNGILVAHSSSASSQTVLRNIVFSRNRIGVNASSMGAWVQISIRDCQIADSTISTAPMLPPQYQVQAIGLKFAAEDGSGAGNLKAEVVELMTSGDFSSMGGEVLTGNSDLGLSVASRLIDVTAQGEISEHSGGILQDISDVELIVQGGVWDGKAAANGGWDLAMYAAAVQGGPAPDPVDYLAGYRVTVTGTEVHDFKVAGMAAVSNIYARGRLELNGQTVIRDTGSFQTHSSGSPAHSGVHLFARESYLAFIGNNCSLFDNTGHGLWANNPDEQFVPHSYPQGIFVGMTRSEVHRNQGSGIGLSVGSGTATGAVGGTSRLVLVGTTVARHLSMNGLTLQSNVGPSSSATLEHGQGRIERTAVSSNGESGMHVESTGTYDPAFANDPDAVVNIRLSNAFVWNNPASSAISGHGGLTVKLQPASNEVNTGLCLLPVTHCTFVNNGQSGGWNIEFDDGSSGSNFRGRYEWALLHEPRMLTRVYDSILYRDIPLFLANDLGTGLELVGQGDFPGSNPPPERIGLASLRCVTSITLDSTSTSWTTPLPFLQQIPDLSSIDPMQFYLNGTTLGSVFFINDTAIYLPYDAPECAQDHQGESRPAYTTGNRDKGADEFHP